MTLENYRSPSDFYDSLLFSRDFDGTTALTSEPSPAGIGVPEVYEIAIDSMFGPLTLDRYRQCGGLRGRAPSEVVAELAPDAAGTELDILVESFVQAKLKILLGEVGTRLLSGEVWPRPMPGYMAFLEKLELARSEGLTINDAVISSGHEPFIEKTYRAWGVRQPEILIAEDTMRREFPDKPAELIIKPSPLLFAAAVNRWREHYSLTKCTSPDPKELERVIFTGDNPKRDGEMARQSGVRFVLMTISDPLKAWGEIGKFLKINGY